MQNPVLPQPIDFEWDTHNSTKVRLRHDIDPKEAEQPFYNEPKIIFDEKHSAVEKRYQLLGISNIGRVLFIVLTIRRAKIRIISARLADKRERIYYYEKEA